MNQMLSVLFSLAFLVIGLAAVIIMLNLQGNPKDRPSSKTLRGLHRLLGYLFLFIFVINLIFMSRRMVGIDMEPSARLTLHIALALVLIPVFLVKISIARFFKKLYPYLMPLGLIVFAASFLMIAVSAGYHLMSTAEPPEEAGPQEVQSISEQNNQTGILETGADSEKILQQKCTICHNLDRVRQAKKNESEWSATIERMIGYSKNPQHLSEGEKAHLITMLTSGGNK
jgi:cytochrome c5